MSDTRTASTAFLTRKISFFLFAFTAICIPLQVMLGADILTLFLAVCGIFLALLVFQKFPTSNPGGWLLFFYVFGNTLFAFIFKTILLQKIDSNLYDPEGSYFIELLATAALSFAVILASKISVGRPFLGPELKVKKLRFLTWSSLLIGCIGWHFSGTLNGQNATQIGGFSSFHDLTYMAVICKTAMLLETKQSKRLFDFELTVILIINLIFGSLANSQTVFAAPVTAYFATILFFRGRIPLSYIAISIVFGIFFISFVAPLIHVLRFLGQQQLSITQRADLVLQAISGVISGGEASRLQQNSSELYDAGYYNYFGNASFGQFVFSRFAAIQQIDPVVGQVSQQGGVGLPIISAALHSIVPGIIDSTKLPYSMSYYVLLHYGFVSPFGGKSPTLPMAGELLAGYGPVGTFGFVFLVFFLYLVVFKKICWSLNKNVFAIFFFVDFMAIFASQGSVEEYLTAALREMPSDAIIFLLLQYIANLRLTLSGAGRRQISNN